MSARIFGGKWPAGVVFTTGATTADMPPTDVVPDGTTFLIEVNVQGKDTTSGELASCVFRHQGKRVSGAVQLVGSPSFVVSFVAGSDIALVSATAAILVASNALNIRVTGVATRTIEWWGDLHMRIH
jgi:hypothetical protein